MSDDALERLILGYLDGTLAEADRKALADRLEQDPAARAEFADQLQIHHRLETSLRGDDSPSLAPSVLREIRMQGDSHRFARQVVSRLKGGRFASMLRFAPILAAASLLLMVGWFIFAPGEPAAPAAVPRGEALLVVGRLPMEPGDRLVRDRLERLGFRVAVKVALAAEAADADGRALVALSSSALAEDLADVPKDMRTRFRDVAVPVLVWEPRLFVDLGLIRGTEHGVDWAASPEARGVTILDPGHSMAAGTSGTVEVLASRGRLSWGRVTGNAIRIATLQGAPDRTALFGYEAGVPMAGGLKAPARRAGIFLFDTSAPHLTPAGWRLFDAAALWCLGK